MVYSGYDSRELYIFGPHVIEPGDFEIQIGASSSDIKLRDLITAE
jgi:hypothetical protein